MTETTNLALPFIAASQAQKHVTHNEALRILDAAIQIAVRDLNRTTPPSGPSEGDRHIVAASPTGAWAGKANAVAIWQDGSWTFLTPKPGWLAWSLANSALMNFDGSAWRDLRASPLDNLARLGVNTSASAPNLLAVRSNAALLSAINVADSGSGDVRLQLSKESAAKTASLVLSDAFSGRAELGLAGDDNLHVKVSPDGIAWTEAIRIAGATGKVSFPASGGPREMLAANRTYYVRTDGNDSNSGLGNTSGGAFLTVQKAVDTVCSLDLSIYQVTIQVADGTYTGAIDLKPYLGALPPIIQGNATTPANVLISTAGTAFNNAGGGVWQINHLKLTTSAGNGLNVVSGGVVRFQNLDFGAVAAYQIFVGPLSNVIATGNYAVSGGALYHVIARGYVLLSTFTITYSGSPAYAGAIMNAGRGGIIDCYGMTFVNSAGVTGTRYFASHNAIIFTNDGGPTYLPGSVAGGVSSGALYV